MIFCFKDVEVYYEKYVCRNETSLPVVIFLHGWGGSGGSFSYFAQSILNKTTSILIDFPPFRFSKEPKEPWEVKDYAQLVLSLLDFLKIDNYIIVAHSFGGRVALEIAKDKDARLKGMLLTGCAGIKRKSFKTKLRIGYFKFLKFLAKIKLVSQKRLDSFGSSDYKNLSPNMKKTFKNIVNYDETGILDKITCFVKFIWGINDKETPIYFTKIFKKHIKNCEVVFIRGSHFAYLENKELFLKYLVDFLEKGE